MSDPKRLLESGSELQRQLLQAGSDEQVPDAVSARMAAALGLGSVSIPPAAALTAGSGSAGAAQGGAATGSTASGVAGGGAGLAVKLGAGAALLGALTGGVYLAWPDQAPVPVPPTPPSAVVEHPETVAPRPTAVADETVADEPVLSEPTPRNVVEPLEGAPGNPAPAPRSEAQATTKKQPAAGEQRTGSAPPEATRSAGDVAGEVRLIDAARSAIEQGQEERAHQLLDRYAREFPRGVLRQEARVLRRAAN